VGSHIIKKIATPQSAFRSLLLSIGLLPLGLTLNAQTVQTVLSNAASAFSQGKAVNTVTLNATANWIAGSDNETGTATLIASADGSYSIQLQLAQSSRTEAQTSFASGQSCTWSGTDGVSHAVAPHNCMGSMASFLPELALFGAQQPVSITTVLVGTTASGTSQLIDLRQQRTPATALSGNANALFAHLSTVDLYLDSTTYLPTALAFNIHPDDNSASDIPVQILFTNYTTVNGVSLPFHIQRYVNGSLNLDLVVTQASAN
jgi:hypothetical protein